MTSPAWIVNWYVGKTCHCVCSHNLLQQDLFCFVVLTLLFLRAGIGLSRFWSLLDYCFSTREGAENVQARDFQLDCACYIFNYWHRAFFFRFLMIAMKVVRFLHQIVFIWQSGWSSKVKENRELKSVLHSQGDKATCFFQSGLINLWAASGHGVTLFSMKHKGAVYLCEQSCEWTGNRVSTEGQGWSGKVDPFLY